MKNTSGNNVINRYNFGKKLNERKLIIKTMKIIRYDKHDKENKNGNSYAITNLNKICHEVKKHKYVANQTKAVQSSCRNVKIPNNLFRNYHKNQSSVPWVLWF